MNNPTITCESRWRGLDMTIQDHRQLSAAGSDPFYVIAISPFPSKGPDYLVRWLPSRERAYREN